MKNLSLFSLIAVVAIISVLFIAGCGDDGSTTFTTGTGGTTGPAGPQGTTGVTGVTGNTGVTGPVDLEGLTVNVVDSAGPVTDATITLSHLGIPSSELISSAPGDYTFTNLTAGKYRLCVEAVGRKKYCIDIDIPYAGGIVSVTLDDGLESLNMVLIPAGSFQMGQTGITEAEPVHQVTLTKDFYMGKYEVTNGEFVRFLNAQTVINPNWLDSPPFPNNDYCGLTGDINYPSGIQVKKTPYDYTNRPVVYVTWYGAVAYCNWLSEEYGYTPGTGKGYRLPTEAEWEYACRGGTNTNFYWGNDPNAFDSPPAPPAALIFDYCWFVYNSNTGSGNNHQNVGLKLPNQFGLYDMSGNVWEWCSDWFDDYSIGSQTDPTGPASPSASYGSNRVGRGGGWSGIAVGCRSAYRYDDCPVNAYGNIGFRPVRSVL